MKVCKKCLYTDRHPLGLIIYDDGVCSGCKVHEEKDSIDWIAKAAELDEVLAVHRNSKNQYDCIVPVTGGQDSYFILDLIKNKYHMNPLCVSYNTHFNTNLGVRNLANLRKVYNIDLIVKTVNPLTVKKITRSTLRRFGSVYWHCLAGQTVFPVQLAVKKRINLIIWGAHQGVDQVGMFSHHHKVEMTRKYRKDHDLMGYEAEDLISSFDDITYNDIENYKYPSIQEIESTGLRGIYLNNYVRWDSRQQHENMIAKFDYQTKKQKNTFDSYNNIDCWIYNDIHDYLKYLKHGYSKVVDHLTRDIRLGYITRDKAVEIASKYQNIYPQYIDQFCRWLNIDRSAIDFIFDQHRNLEFWERSDEFDWLQKNTIPVKQNKSYDTEYTYIHTLIDRTSDDVNDYILIGKGV